MIPAIASFVFFPLYDVSLIITCGLIIILIIHEDILVFRSSSVYTYTTNMYMYEHVYIQGVRLLYHLITYVAAKMLNIVNIFKCNCKHNLRRNDC